MIPATTVIEALEAAFAGTRERAIPELALALGEATAQRPAHITSVKTFKRGVHRLGMVVDDEPRTLVAKRLGVIQARRNEHVFESWLPAEGLLNACPALLGRASERRGAFAWHVYEDIGDRSLASDGITDSDIDAVVQLIARVHGRFARHPMLGEARSMGGDLGFRFFETNIGDALHGVNAARKLATSASNTALCDRLIERLHGWRASMPARARAFEDHAGPETLLHGDLWRTNAFAADHGARPCLIDWDHAGAGPASYDMSTFLLRFPHERRRRILDRYRAAMATEGTSVAGADELNVLFETAELSRYANRLGWLALALLEGNNDWAWEKVEGVEEWFDRLKPVIPGCQPSPKAEGMPA
ncbi:MAG TPA: aminoglycoside phosphotransferase family protein [Planctomycetota bacterium]|nr:aminoglycoside phosphotransferase family protein [Planctomycetota bacterium]